MKSFLKNFSIAIVCLVLFFIFGYFVGKFDTPTANYKKGIVSFCKLTGGDRIKVCPYLRTMEISGRGSITTYVCKKDFSHIYIETSNISKIAYIKFEELMYSHKVFAKVLCITPKGRIYELRAK